MQEGFRHSLQCLRDSRRARLGADFEYVHSKGHRRKPYLYAGARRHGGRTFWTYEFRTMVADSDDVENYPNADQLNQWRLERKIDDEPRITPLGQKLRSTSVDEIPNFIYVLKGDMSAIGPRAVLREEVECFGDDAETMFSVPVDITGLWLVGARYDATFESGERQKIELEYVRNAGFAMDARCFFRNFRRNVW